MHWMGNTLPSEARGRYKRTCATRGRPRSTKFDTRCGRASIGDDPLRISALGSASASSTRPCRVGAEGASVGRHEPRRRSGRRGRMPLSGSSRDKPAVELPFTPDAFKTMLRSARGAGWSTESRMECVMPQMRTSASSTAARVDRVEARGSHQQHAPRQATSAAKYRASSTATGNTAAARRPHSRPSSPMVARALLSRRAAPPRGGGHDEWRAGR